MPSDPAEDAHVLIPPALTIDLPHLYSTEHQDDPLARIKLFTPDSSWTWYVVEYDPDERLCFGLVIGHEREMGYFSLAELEEARGPMRLRVERDLYFKPTPLLQCR
jgi:hypothetical protein